MSQQPAPAAPVTTSNRIWTVPNVISFIRLLGVPLFLYLLIGPHHDGAAVAVLALGGTTDWVDGYVARRLGQVSRLGELLDPFADRLYILAALIGLTVRDIVPWWLTAALLLREAVLGVALLVLRRHGYGPPPVHYLGKTGTFVLLFAFPVLLLAKAAPAIAPVVSPIGWGLAWWALGLYWAAAVLYLAQTAALLRADRAARPPGGPVPGGAASEGRASDGPAVSGPASDGPAVSGPASDGPAVDGPASDGPAVDGPASDGPAVDGPASDGPAVDGPVARQASGEPRSGGPAADGAGTVAG